MSDADAMAALLVAVDGDGFNGDTMKYIPQAFYNAGIERTHPIAMEAEGPAPITELGYDTLNWGEVSRSFPPFPFCRLPSLLLPSSFLPSSVWLLLLPLLSFFLLWVGARPYQ